MMHTECKKRILVQPAVSAAGAQAYGKNWRLSQ